MFFDDILVYSPNFQDHVIHLQIILELLETKKFYAKLSKCSFTATQVSYLGHLISPKGVASNPDKVFAIHNWP